MSNIIQEKYGVDPYTHSYLGLKASYPKGVQPNINPDISVPAPNNSTYGPHLQFDAFPSDTGDKYDSMKNLSEEKILNGYLERRERNRPGGEER